MSTPHSQRLEDLRAPTFAIAYRMLGSVAEAEDVVQETLLRVHGALVDEQRIESLRAYAATIATRLAIDQLRSARARRETYVGEWLPEPLVTDAASDPARQAELADSLSLAFLVLLERLSPEQRAALLLRDVFDYGYDEIAQIIDTTAVNARQLAARARRHVRRHRPRFSASHEHSDELARRFFAAAQDGDLEALERLLAQDVVLRGDGGGNVPAIVRSVHGRASVARTLLLWARLGVDGGGSMRPTYVNGHPGALGLDHDGRLLSVMALDIIDGQIHGVCSIVNPDKLRHVGDVGDMRALLHGDAPRPSPTDDN